MATFEEVQSYEWWVIPPDQIIYGGPVQFISDHYARKNYEAMHAIAAEIASLRESTDACESRYAGIEAAGEGRYLRLREQASILDGEGDWQLPTEDHVGED